MVKRLPRIKTKLAVLAIISKRSKGRGRTIAAASIREIKNDLEKHYLKNVTEKRIRNVIQDLGKLVIKERNPRDRRQPLYRINPNMVEEAILSLVKLDDEKAYAHNGYEGILYDPPPSPQEARFLAIDDVDHPTGVGVDEEFQVEVKVSYCFMNPTRIFVGAFDGEDLCWLATATEILWGEGVKSYVLSMTPFRLGNWRLKVNVYYLEGLSWREADSMLTVIPVEDEGARMMTFGGSVAVNHSGEWTKECYKVLMEHEDGTEREGAEAYMHATVNGWLSGRPIIPPRCRLST